MFKNLSLVFVCCGTLLLQSCDPGSLDRKQIEALEICMTERKYEFYARNKVPEREKLLELCVDELGYSIEAVKNTERQSDVWRGVMFKLLSVLGGVAVLAMILFGTWPIIFGKSPVKPIVKPSVAEKVKDAIADEVKDFSLD